MMATPLFKKLGLRPGMIGLHVNAPNDYSQMIGEIYEEVNWKEADNVEFIHVFCKNSQEIEKLVKPAKKKLDINGMIWVSWPKGSSGLQTDINRESVREFLLNIGLVDVKVASVNDEWSALKFVYRLEDR